MQKYIQTTILASAILLLAITAQAKTASEIYEQAAKSTVVVRNFDAKGKQQSMGSGVVMPDGDVVTNCHVVKGASSLTVRVGQIERPATLRYSDWDRDVCALSSSGLNAPSATVGSSKTLKVGAKVYAIGAPKGLELTLSDGIVSSLRDLEGGRYIQTTAAISPGSSGGGLYDDNGALVGLTTFYFAEGQSLNFAVPIDWVKDLSKRSTKAQVATQTTTAWLSKFHELETLKDEPAMLAHTLRWTEAQPNNKDAWGILAIRYYHTKQITKAINAYQQILRIEPKNAFTWVRMAMVYDYFQEYTQAINTYKQALSIHPDDADLWTGLGSTYHKTQQYPQAFNAIQKALRINPESFFAWTSLGLNYEMTQQYPQAIDAYQQALRIKPDDVYVLRYLGNAYHRSGNRPKVLETYKKLRTLDAAAADKFFNSFILPGG